MLVCDELEEVIMSSIQKVAEEMGLEKIPSEINGQVRNAVWDYLQIKWYLSWCIR